MLYVAPPSSRGLQPARTNDSIDHLIESLGASTYRERDDATRKLIALGPQGRAALENAAHGDDLEIAIRARHLLAVMGELLFAGANVELSVSTSRASWNEPVALHLRVRNNTDFPVRIPFEAPRSDASDTPAWVRQAIALLDLSDFLVVRDSDGKRVRLHMDDINENARLAAAVSERVAEPPTSLIAPGAAFDLNIEQFNRGWSRYRLLRGGDYRIQLIYQPEWDDADLVRSGVGRIESNTVAVTVTESAPDCILKGGGPAALNLRRDGSDLVLTLLNQMDVPVWVNRNLSGSGSVPHARVRWYVGEAQVDLVASQSKLPFSFDLLTEVAPAETVELTRVPITSLRPSSRGLQPARTPPPANDQPIHATYSNVTCAAWQRSTDMTRHIPPRDAVTLKKPLPRGMLAATIRSHELHLPKSE